MPTIRQYPDCRFLDVGCGWDYLLLKTVEPFTKSGIGIDFKVQELQINKIKTIRMKMTDFLPFEGELFSQTDMVIEQRRYFQMGMNNFCIVRKI